LIRDKVEGIRMAVKMQQVSFFRPTWLIRLGGEYNGGEKEGKKKL